MKNLTVRQLIDELKKMPQDKDVTLFADNHFFDIQIVVDYGNHVVLVEDEYTKSKLV